MSSRLFLTLLLLLGTVLFTTPTLSHSTDHLGQSKPLQTTNIVDDRISPKPALPFGRHVVSLSGGAKLGYPMGSEVTPGSRSRLGSVRRTLFPIFGRREVTKFLLIGSIKFFIILALTLTRDTKGSFLQDITVPWSCTVLLPNDEVVFRFTGLLQLRRRYSGGYSMRSGSYRVP
jgi:hypothetical protein